MQRNSRIYVAGGNTLIGAAIVRRLEHHGYADLCNDVEEEVDLTAARDVEAYFQRVRPEYVFFAAGRSGGIGANMSFPAELMQDNLLSSIHVIDSAHRHGVRKLLYLASSCSYPKLCPQPMRVADLMSGPVEPTNEAYAVAKLAGIKLCQAYRRQYGDDFIVGIPANAFGPGDDFSLENSHVIAALIRKMHEAARRGDDRVEVWGTGSARREFIFADDLADACIHVMLDYCHEEPINLGGGPVLSIGELARTIRRVVGFTGRLEFDPSKPDGMPMKGLESSRLEGLGWRPRVDFEDALRSRTNGISTTSCQARICEREFMRWSEDSEAARSPGALESKAQWVRRETLRIHHLAPETRIASSLSDVEIFVALYYGGILSFDPADPRWEGRDRFIVSKGHGGVSLYPILADLGFFDRRHLARVCRADSFLGAIPDMLVPGFETINGSLGQGLGVACGIAKGLKQKDVGGRGLCPPGRRRVVRRLRLGGRHVRRPPPVGQSRPDRRQQQEIDARLLRQHPRTCCRWKRSSPPSAGTSPRSTATTSAPCRQSCAASRLHARDAPRRSWPTRSRARACRCWSKTPSAMSEPLTRKRPWRPWGKRNERRRTRRACATSSWSGSMPP